MRHAADTDLSPELVLDELMRQPSVGVGIVDHDLRYVRVSPSLAAMNGASVDEHAGRTVREVLGEVADRLEPVLRGVLAGEPVLDAELEGPDGRVFRVSYLPVKGTSGTVAGIAALVVETTAGRRVEAALQLSRERLQLALEGTQTGTFEYHVATGEIRWSDNLGLIWGRGRGWSPAGYEDYLATLHPDDRDSMVDSVRRATTEGTGYEQEHRILWPDGQVRWVHSRVHVVRNAGGAPSILVGLTSDVTDRRLREQAADYLARASLALAQSLEVESTMQELVELAVPELADWCAVHLAAEGGAPEQIAVAHADPARVELVRELQERYPAEADAPTGVPAVIREGRSELYPAVPDDVLRQAARDEEHLRLLRALGVRSAMIVPMVARGRTLGAITFVSTRPGLDYGTAELELAEELGRRAGLAIQNARLHHAEQAANRRLREVSAVTDVALSHLELDDLLRELLARVRATLEADFSAVLLLDEQRKNLRLVAVDGADIPVDAVVPMGRGVAGRIAASGRPLLVEDVAALNPVLPDLDDAVALVGVPLRAGGEVVGVLHAGMRSARRFTHDDVELLELVADRAARAIVHARLYAQARSTSDTLQRSLLPSELPAIPRLEVAVRYLAGQKGSEVGGDWYDVLALPDGRCAVTVGDVMGRGIGAAAKMGHLRSVLRAYAHELGGAAASVSRLDRFVESTGEVSFATLAQLTLDPATGRGAVCLAGHPPPVLRRASGAASAVEGPPGLPIGAPVEPRDEHPLDLAAGDVVLLYTDGLIERRDADVRERIAALVAAVASAPAEPERLLDHVIGVMVGGGDSEDDLALLAVRRT